MVVRHDVTEYEKDTVGCILTFNGEYVLFHRVKDGLFGSVAGTIGDGEIAIEAALRVLKDKLHLYKNPEFFTQTFHEYGREIVRYNIFHLELDKQLTRDNLDSSKLDGIYQGPLPAILNDSIKLFPDENYCLMQHFLSQFKK